MKVRFLLNSYLSINVFSLIVGLNTEGSITVCYDAAREINCDMYSGKRYYCPGMIYDFE